MSEPYVIRKRGFWYRPDRAGYTASLGLAGLYTKDEAMAEAAEEPRVMTAMPLSDAIKEYGDGLEPAGVAYRRTTEFDLEADDGVRGPSPDATIEIEPVYRLSQILGVATAEQCGTLSDAISRMDLGSHEGKLSVSHRFQVHDLAQRSDAAEQTWLASLIQRARERGIPAKLGVFIGNLAGDVVRGLCIGVGVWAGLAALFALYDLIG